MNILEKIIEETKNTIQKSKMKKSLHNLEELSEQYTKREFIKSIQNKISLNQSAIIAEIKKASPSKGIIRDEFNPIEIATDYEKNGASCLSVLTDKPFFKGDIDYLDLIRKEVEIPLLRKDFIVDEYQIIETKAFGADCLLLIVAALDKFQLKDFFDYATSINLDVLVEVHNLDELETALTISPNLIGINNRNLSTFEVSIQNSIDLKDNIPETITLISESGINNASDLKILSDAGINGFLIGELFMKQISPGKALKELISESV